MVRVHSGRLRVVRSDCQLHNWLIGAASSGSLISKHNLCLGIPETSRSARTPTLSLQMLPGMLIHLKNDPVCMSLCIVAFFLMRPCTASLFQTQRHRPRLSPTTKVWFPPHISRFTSIIATPSGCKRLTYGSKKVPRSSRNMQTLVSKVRFWNVWIFWIYQNLFRRIMNGPRPRSLDRLGADSN